MMLLGQHEAKLFIIIHDNTGWYWLLFGGDGSVWGSTGWCLVVLGQYNLVMLCIKWK